MESQYLGVQKGIEEGVHDGFNFGFDEGFKTGIRIVFRDAREKNIDLTGLDLMQYINKEDKMKAEMKSLYEKLTKVFVRNEKLEWALKIKEKFLTFSEK